MTDSKKSQTSDLSEKRRVLLKSTALGGAGVMAAVPDRWRTPIVDGVMIPAHAQATCGGTGESNTPSLEANITFAVINGEDDLIVVGEATGIPDTCHNTGGEGADGNRMSCTVLADGEVLDFNWHDSFGDEGGEPSECDEIGQFCQFSCSVEVDSSRHSLTSGSCVTLRFSFNGGCVASAVTTVA